ncbi:unnamed protein product [Durusdinium trenchii]|uniref:Uncharacterized protein n=1 Tax=Durusdinium trenchii TaxID=1381693 RepID=A0ABP0PGD5_9DINO
MASCARCRRSAPAGGDTWCLACSAWEALGNELSFAWSHPGLRAVATDLVVSAVRQVRALRVTRGDSSTPRAAPPAAVPPVPGPRVAERTGSVPAGGNSGPERERSPLPRSSGRGRDTGGGPPAPAVEESSEAEDEEEESEAESEKTLLLVAGVKTEVTEERADRAETMTELETIEAAVVEGYGQYGTFDVEDAVRWGTLTPVVGDVLETGIPQEIVGEEGVVGIFLVTGFELGADGGMLVRVKSVGASSPAVLGILSSLFNRKEGKLHLCPGAGSCYEEGGVFHVRRVEVWKGSEFPSQRLSPGGKRLVKQMERGEELDLEQEEEVAPAGRPPALKGRRSVQGAGEEARGKGVGEKVRGRGLVRKTNRPAARLPGDSGPAALRAAGPHRAALTYGAKEQEEQRGDTTMGLKLQRKEKGVGDALAARFLAIEQATSHYLGGEEIQQDDGEGKQARGRQSVERVLGDDERAVWGLKEVLQDFERKSIGYSGEEICKAEPLSLERMLPGLPPEGHGGSINTIDWVSGHTRYLLLNPDKCVAMDVGQTLPKLQGKVHIKEGERLPIARELVRRGICRWIPESKVATFRGQKVLSGLFGVAKPKKLPSGECVLRLIMNLVPANAVLRTIAGKVEKLPSITQWLNVVIEEGETLRIAQSDMACAFYLFSLPEAWSSLLSFNLHFPSSVIGDPSLLSEKEELFLACRVLPMGWSSAVGVMQAIAESVLIEGGFNPLAQITKTSPLPPWVLQSAAAGSHQGKPWWHVYLDNFAAGSKVQDDNPEELILLQQQAEGLWKDAGIVVSEGKSVVAALRVLGELREMFPGVRVDFFVENVASMDVEVRDEVSDLLGAAFMDQKGSRYQEDMLKMEPGGLDSDALFGQSELSEGLLHPGAVIVADNVLKPGAPLFLYQIMNGGRYHAQIVSLDEFAMPSEDWMSINVKRIKAPENDTEPPDDLHELSKETDRMRERAVGPGRSVTYDEWAEFAQDVKSRLARANVSLTVDLRPESSRDRDDFFSAKSR